MKINKLILTAIAALALTANESQAQSTAAEYQAYYNQPVTYQIFLAGNIGEVRTTHFHSGMDIKASQGVGAPILATADGYISRIGVSTSGYGKVLYITHPNGETSVYGHLNDFNSKIAEWVKSRQYQKKGYKVDLYPVKSDFPVKQGDTIAYLGNTGSSGGPHLHFEIRNKYNNPLNLVKLGLFNIKDNIPPTFGSVTMYQCDTVAGITKFTKQKTINAISKGNGEYQLEEPILHSTKPFYLVYDVIDYKNGSPNTMGIYSMTQMVDNLTNYSFEISKTSFTTSKYSSTMVEFAQDRLNKFHSIRSYISANNPLSIYRNVRNRGIITPTLDSTKNQQIQTVIEDDNGNRSVLKFEVASSPVSGPNNSNFTLEKNQRIVNWNEEFVYQDSIVKLTIPNRTLYDSQIFSFSSNPDGTEFTIEGDNVPLHKSVEVVLNVGEIPTDKQSKALLRKTKGSGLAMTTYSNGQLTAKISSLGTYKVTYDTTPPTITPLKTQNNQIRFKVTDDLAGVNSYKLMVDNKWELLEYEPKEKLMFYRYDASQTAKLRKVEVTVTDYSGNSNTYSTKLTF